MKVQIAGEAADVLAAKHESLRVLAASVLRHVPESELLIVDWRESDPLALGFALRANPERIASVCRFSLVPGYLLLSTGRPDPNPANDFASDPFNDLDALASAIAADLGPA